MPQRLKEVQPWEQPGSKARSAETAELSAGFSAAVAGSDDYADFARDPAIRNSGFDERTLKAGAKLKRKERRILKANSRLAAELS